MLYRTIQRAHGGARSGGAGVTIQPFLKWAGGKRWLAEGPLSELKSAVKYNRYVEPFLGSGAVFFSFEPPRALLADSNPDLIKTYAAVRDGWRRVSQLIREHHKRHCKDYYYRMRSSRPKDRFERAANFIYLNRACWNGLYRVN